ncbi:MAG: hypothetical protein WA085_13405 [Sphingobium sp.]
MTTQVIVKSPSPNHQDVMVRTVTPQTGDVMSEQRLREGEEVSLYVHGSQSLQIAEIAKEPAEAPAA